MSLPAFLSALRADLPPDADAGALADLAQAALVVAHALDRLAIVPPAERPARGREIESAWGESAMPELVAFRSPLRALDRSDGENHLLQATRVLVESLEIGGGFHMARSLLALARVACTHASTHEQGLTLLQEARAARQAGELVAAGDLYLSGFRLGEQTGDDELRARALIGTGVLANMRGNYPEARERFLAAADAAAEFPAHRAAAHHGLMIAATAANDLTSALEHGWAAFQHLAGDATRRGEVLINLSEICRRTGRHAAALQGMLAALQLTDLPRLRLAAIGGAAIASALLGDKSRLRQLAMLGREEVSRSRHAFENARTLLELGEAHHRVGDAETRDQFLHDALARARAGGFHEVVFRAEGLLHRAAPESEQLRAPAVEATGSDVIGYIETLPLEGGRLALAGA